MKTQNSCRQINSDRGSALIVTIIITAIAVVSVATFFALVTREVPMQAKRIDRNRALEIADAGIEHALWQLNINQTWWQSVCESYEEGVQSDDYELTSPDWLFDDGEWYEVDVDHYQDTVTGRPTFFIRATGYIQRYNPGGGEMKTLKTMGVMTRPEGFHDYARFVSNGSLSYGANAILDGKVHTNGDLRLNGRPVTFRRKVTAGGSIINESNGVFFDEVESRADQIPLPDTTIQFRNLAQTGGIYLNPSSTKYIDLSTLTYPANFNGILYCTKDIKVKGTPTRPITLVSADDIYINGHIRQSSDPKNVVGLIAKDYVYLDASTPNNLEVTASLMAIKNTWKALGYGSKYGLTINGSIVTNTGGSAGPYLAGERHYNYDRRLLYYMPPYYPDFPGGGYILTAWTESLGEQDWRDSGLTAADDFDSSFY